MENYGLSSANTTPLTPHDAYGPVWGSYDSSRTWSGAHQRCPMAYYPGYGEQDAASQVSYVSGLPSRQSTVADGTTVFNTASLTRSLPNPNSTATERVLPIPHTTTRQHFTNSLYDAGQLRAATSGMASGSTHFGASPYPRTISNWTAEQATSGARSDSIPNTRSNEMVAPVPQKPSNASSTSSDSSPVAYIPSSESPDVSPTTATSSNENPAHSTSSSHVDINLGTPPHSMYTLPPGSLGDAAISRQGSQSMYTFSVDRRDSETSRLGNGDKYEPLQVAAPQPDRIANVDSFRLEGCRSRASFPRHRVSHPTVNTSS